MVYIVATMLRKAIQDADLLAELKSGTTLDAVWKKLILLPDDFSQKAIFDPITKKLMDLMEFEHGGKSFDEKYPEGIPTSIQITLKDSAVLDSQLVMFPSGHAKNTQCDLRGILDNKFKVLGKIALVENEI